MLFPYIITQVHITMDFFIQVRIKMFLYIIHCKTVIVSYRNEKVNSQSEPETVFLVCWTLSSV